VVCFSTVPLLNWVVCVVEFTVGGTAFNAVGSWTTLTGGFVATGSVSAQPTKPVAATPINAAITRFMIVIFIISENAIDVPENKGAE
jgi:hypothetical protein